MKLLLKIATLSLLTLPIAYGLRDRAQGRVEAAMTQADRHDGFHPAPQTRMARGERHVA